MLLKTFREIGRRIKAYHMIFDYIFGISNTLGDEKSFDGNQKLADYIYGAVASTDEDGNQPTWAQIREQYSATVDSEIKDMNKRLSPPCTRTWAARPCRCSPR